MIRDSYIDTKYASKFISGRAAVRGEPTDQFGNKMSPRDLNEEVANIGEKTDYKGFHAYQNKGLITGGDDLLPRADQEKTPMQKLLER